MLHLGPLLPRGGMARWWWQRLSGVLLVLLGGWWLWSLAYWAAADYAWVRLWVQQPAVGLALWLLMLLLCIHAGLGVQGIIEDYAPNGWRYPLRIALMSLLGFALALMTALLVLLQWDR